MGTPPQAVVRAAQPCSPPSSSLVPLPQHRRTTSGLAEEHPGALPAPGVAAWRRRELQLKELLRGMLLLHPSEQLAGAGDRGRGGEEPAHLVQDPRRRL